MYDNKAYEKGCHDVYTMLKLRMRWEARSWLTVCTKISDRSTKFKSLTCTTRMSDLNLLPSVQNETKNY